MSKRLAWCKLFESWYTTRSHVELGGVALNIGPRLMSLANSSANSSRTVTPLVRGDVRGPSGAPLSLSAIAREVRFSEKETEEALRQLVACGTLIQKDDGCWAFPYFEAWQETKDAARMRAHRERTTGVTVTRTVTGVVTPVSVLSTSVSSSSSSEEGVQREEGTNPDDVGALWNDVCGRALPSISKLTDKRRAKVRSRCLEPGRDLAWWRAYFQRIADSPFLRGDVKAWCADFDWAVKDETTVAKVLEGAYDQRGTPTAPDRENATQFALRLAREERAREAARADTGQLRLAPGAER